MNAQVRALAARRALTAEAAAADAAARTRIADVLHSVVGSVALDSDYVAFLAG
jgi:hypothetical protein